MTTNSGLDIGRQNRISGVHEELQAQERQPSQSVDWFGNAQLTQSEVFLLVIDDEPAICRIIKSALASPQLIVESVSEAGAIEAQLQAKPYHLVLLDYTLPGVKTNVVFDWARRYQPDAAIIVITGNPTVENAVDSMRHQAFDFLVKPIQVSQFRDVVRRCLEAKGLLRMSEDALRESLGATIRKRRKELGLTLAQLAQRSDVSLGYLSQIELGKNSASVETLYRICLGLSIKMTDLFASQEM